MTRGEAGKRLNAIFEALDAVQDGIRGKQVSSRCKERINAIRDQVVLLALDLRLPVAPLAEKTDAGDPGQAPTTG